MNEMSGKYVITHLGQSVLFPKSTVHADFRGYRPVSAGFFEIWCSSEGSDAGTLYVSAYGESETLHLKSRKEDADIIRRQLGVF